MVEAPDLAADLREDGCNVADITMAITLLSAVDKPKRLLADKAYDADSFRIWLKQRKIKAVIPSTATRRTPYPLDQKTYRRRNVIERMFCKLKNWRRIATRYDRHAQTTSQDSHSPPSCVSGFE